ncbi:TetR/AcrR family transcriptional regulator [Promicromonospora umidemergens]|uniref:TetR/AcrR family transcriptional regulator n=1 Tax=Promicromonospora umidemergens TaxID=629679 RepID=A0ABP8XAE6_9MICO|nr:TetR/AcrR family transcriptional regulator [Promicromonospora umidemergens]
MAMRRREGTVSAAKHEAIREAATRAFLEKGYAGTSMDEVAALAEVGKQTVYKHFSDKRQLFTDIVLATTHQVDGLVRLIAQTLDASDDPRSDLEALAHRFLTTLMQPQMLRLRRLVIANAADFPELGEAWYELGFERVLSTLTSSFSLLDERGVLRVPDPESAAEHFVGILLWIPLNKAMFTGNEHAYTEDALRRRADLAVHAFLDLYRVAEHPLARNNPATDSTDRPL